MDLERLRKSLGEQAQSLPPVEDWDPEFCGDIELQIKHSGQWFYMGTPIGRPALVKLFASVLKKQEQHYYLVTPVEKVGIQVEDVPFVVTEWRQRDEYIMMTTSVGDHTIVSPQNPVILQQDRTNGAVLPYLCVRRNLYARLHQNVFYQLADIATIEPGKEGDKVMVSSGNYQFSLGNC
ncbi:MAG: DUF1285 domain-containing protein [Aestuariibacter sp.]